MESGEWGKVAFGAVWASHSRQRHRSLSRVGGDARAIRRFSRAGYRSAVVDEDESGHNGMMPRLLYKYMLTELLRVALLTTVVLVLVIAFGAAIKPLAKETLLTAGQTAKYIMLATVPMLQFALPFAAGFAGTMSLHRMTEDNEIIAASASGISYRRLLGPIAALGLSLMLVMVMLTQIVIPKFWGLLERTVAQDITSIFQASIDRGEPFVLGDWQIWADRLIVQEDPEDTEADTRLILVQVAVAALDEDGRIDEDVTANQAVVDIYRRPEATHLKLILRDVVGFQPNTGTLISMPTAEPKVVVIPSVLQDDARRMTRWELVKLRGDPDTYGSVIEKKTPLAESLRDVEMWRQADRRLDTAGEVELSTLAGPKQRFVVRADRLRNGRFVTSDARPVEVVSFQGASARRQFRADKVELQRRPSGSLGGANFDLVFVDCEVMDLDYPQTPNRRERVAIENLSFSDVTVEDLSELSGDELLVRVDALGEGADAIVLASGAKLRHEIQELQREITGRLLKRYALSATAAFLMILGAVLAMWLRNSLPLVIYLLAFLPSVANLILISSGEHMMRDGHMVGGFAVMWSGNGVLVALSVGVFFLLSRN